MSVFEIRMPELGGNNTEATLMAWLTENGNYIEEDEPLFEICTNENRVITSPVSGRVMDLLFQQGELVTTGTIMAVIDTDFKPEDKPEEEIKTDLPEDKNRNENSLSSAKLDEGDEVQDMDKGRRILADHMLMSKKISPHITNVVEVDVTKMVHWRQYNKDEFEKREGYPLTYMSIIAEATIKALKEFPQINASLDEYKIILKKHINLGIVVSLEDGNLVIPVIPDADRLNINGLALAIHKLADKARHQKLDAEELQGGTFTITNFGTCKNLFGTPIINQPEAAILGVGYIEKRPAVLETPDGDVITLRHKMYLSLSYDPRIVDGARGGWFLRRIADYLENWTS